MVLALTVARLIAVITSACAGERCASDWNNALKIGLDAHTLRYSAELENAPFSDQLPQKIVQPGATIASICPRAAERLKLPADCEVAAGVLALVCTSRHSVVDCQQQQLNS